MRSLLILILFMNGLLTFGQEHSEKLNHDIDSIKEQLGLKLYLKDKATDFTVKMINGETIKLSDLKGKVVLLNFWATWCKPCISEFKEIPNKILKPFKDKDFVFLPISRGEEENKVKRKMDQLKEMYGIEFNAGVDSKKEIWDKYGTRLIPKNFVIDKNGVIQFIANGYSEKGLEKIAKEIEKLFDD